LAWTIELSAQATRQLGHLDKTIARLIRRFLNERLATAEDPRSLGIPLQGVEWQGYWRFRVGDHRIVCDIQNAKLVILALEIGHRSTIYR
jgi:mRNA interferase RelE/StbE